MFLLGVIFLLIGWRWQNPRSEENLVALKGLAYLRSEVLRVQDRVHVLEDEILKAKLLYNHENQTIVDHQALDIKKKDQKDAVSKELEYQENGLKKLELQKIELNQDSSGKESKKVEFKEADHIQKARLYSISPQGQRERSNKPNKRLFDEKTEPIRQAPGSAPQANHHVSGKFREVLELAANGQGIPEISQHLFISQDAVRMVLSMQSKGDSR